MRDSRINLPGRPLPVRGECPDPMGDVESDMDADKIVCLRGGRVIDPASGRDAAGDVWIKGGVIVEPQEGPAEVVDCTGLLVTPGLIDMHVHLREPGQESKETIYSGTRAAAAGGYTSICCIPNTRPVIDSQTGIKFILSRAQTDAAVNVFPYASITKGQEGRELTEFGDLLQAGAVGFTDDGLPIMNNQVMRRALEYSKTFGTLILDHCEDKNLAEGGVMFEGELSTRLGLKGWPSVAESIHVVRDIDLAEFTGARIHIFHVSTRASITFIRNARARGVRVSGEVSPHHLTLTVDALKDYDTNFKMNPPLATEADRRAAIEALRDGTLEVIATDHAPHTQMEKDEMFAEAPNGIIGMETAFAVLNTGLVRTGEIGLPRIIEAMTVKPAGLLGLDKGTLAVGAAADVAVFDTERAWTVDPEQFHSKSRNCPWNGQELVGRPVRTYVAGRLVYNEGQILV